MLKISIVTVVLNGAETIEQTIKSVIGQDYPNVEYIIVDGGSTDGTTEIIEKYTDKISYWICEKDNGVYSAMNKGIEKADGDYINFLNSDDWLEKGVISRVARYIDNTNADIVYGDYNRVYGDGSKKRIYARPLDYINIAIPFCHQSVFIRNSTDLVFDEKYRIAADYKMMLDLYNNGKKYCYIPCVISNFRSGGLSDKNVHKTLLEIGIIAAEALVQSKKNANVYGQFVVNNLIESEFGMRLLNEDYNSIVDFIKETIPIEDGVIIFGIGDLFEKYYDFLKKGLIPIRYFIDNDPKKTSKTIMGKNVYRPDVLKEEKTAIVIVLNQRYCCEMRDQLEQMELSSGVMIFEYEELKKRYLHKEKRNIIDSVSQINESVAKLNSMISRDD